MAFWKMWEKHYLLSISFDYSSLLCADSIVKLHQEWLELSIYIRGNIFFLSVLCNKCGENYTVKWIQRNEFCWCLRGPSNTYLRDELKSVYTLITEVHKLFTKNIYFVEFVIGCSFPCWQQLEYILLFSS